MDKCSPVSCVSESKMVTVKHIHYGTVLMVFLGLVIHIIGFATPGWTGNKSVHVGLWQTCNDRFRPKCSNFKTSDGMWHGLSRQWIIIAL